MNRILGPLGLLIGTSSIVGGLSFAFPRMEAALAAPNSPFMSKRPVSLNWSGCITDRETGQKVPSLELRLSGFLSDYGPGKEVAVTLASLSVDGTIAQGPSEVGRYSIDKDDKRIPLEGSIKPALGIRFRLNRGEAVVVSTLVGTKAQLGLAPFRGLDAGSSNMVEIEDCRRPGIEQE